MISCSRVSSSLGGEIADVIASTLFVPRFWPGRLGESLEVRIISERIEHRIEPEQRRSERARWARVWHQE
jgi:hypothetical protein